MANLFFSVPSPPQKVLFSHSHKTPYTKTCLHGGSTTTPVRYQTFSRPITSSSTTITSTSTSVVEEDVPPLPPPSSPDALSIQSESSTQDSDNLPFGGCQACGKDEIEKGCNGEGRIQGGIATVPGFGWWPIKAYRPCPAFLASGGRYRRQGQSMDDVVSGGGGQRSSSTSDQQY